MFCKYCGARIPDDADFCTECGKRLKRPDTDSTIKGAGPLIPPETKQPESIPPETKPAETGPVPERTLQGSLFCPFCSHPLKPQANFCPICGKAVPKKTPLPAESTPAPANNPIETGNTPADTESVEAAGVPRKTSDSKAEPSEGTSAGLVITEKEIPDMTNRCYRKIKRDSQWTRIRETFHMRNASFGRTHEVLSSVDLDSIGLKLFPYPGDNLFAFKYSNVFYGGFIAYLVYAGQEEDGISHWSFYFKTWQDSAWVTGRMFKSVSFIELCMLCIDPDTAYEEKFSALKSKSGILEAGPNKIMDKIANRMAQKKNEQIEADAQMPHKLADRYRPLL